MSDSLPVDLRTQGMRLLAFCAAHSLDALQARGSRGRVAIEEAKEAFEKALVVLNWAHRKPAQSHVESDAKPKKVDNRPFRRLKSLKRADQNKVRQWLRGTSEALQRQPDPEKRLVAVAEMLQSDDYLQSWVRFLFSDDPYARPPLPAAGYNPLGESSPVLEVVEAFFNSLPPPRSSPAPYSAPPAPVTVAATYEPTTSIDGSVKLLDLDLSDKATLQVEYRATKPPIDLTRKQPTKAELEGSLRDFSKKVRDFILLRLKTPSALSLQWKLGLQFVELPNAHQGTKQARVVVGPLSYRVTDVFNRAYVLRLAARYANVEPPTIDEDLDALVPECAAEVQASRGSFNLPFPSQLFVELALITADDQVLLMRKRDNPGVVAAIGRSWTCGPEVGLLVSDMKKGGKIVLQEVVLKALQKELGVDASALVSWHIAGLALQNVHLNSALYGHCRLSLRADELMTLFLRKGVELGRSDPFHRGIEKGEPAPRLVPFDQLPALLAQERMDDGQWWHPTAKRRLQSLLDAQAR